MKLLSLEDVCDQLGISRWTVTKLVNTGQLKASKLGKLYKFKQEDVNEYIKNNEIN